MSPLQVDALRSLMHHISPEMLAAVADYLSGVENMRNVAQRHNVSRNGLQERVSKVEGILAAARILSTWQAPKAPKVSREGLNILALIRYKALPISKIAEKIGLTESSTTGHLQRLSKQGLVRMGGKMFLNPKTNRWVNQWIAK